MAAGDGRLRDGSECSRELRESLSEAPSECLFQYIRHCLDASFDGSGFVLQDVVNEVGRRLEFEIEHGLYRGKKTNVGYDGIWRSNSVPDILVEVKTSDYVVVSLDRIVSYKRVLVDRHEISADASILIVVGREDTGALEAQIRGSRYAWDMRLISADRLSNLLQIKEKSNEDTTVRQITELLRPFEYTKIDKIIDVIFATAEDVVTQATESELGEQAGYTQIRTDRDLLNNKRQAAVDALGDKIGTQFLRNRQTLFWSSDKSRRVCAAVSKRYDDYQPYWYAYHPAWNAFLQDGTESYFLLACMDRDEAYAIPLKVVHENLDNLHTTVRPDGRSYYHIKLSLNQEGMLEWNMAKAAKKLPLDGFSIPLISHRARAVP